MYVKYPRFVIPLNAQKAAVYAAFKCAFHDIKLAATNDIQRHLRACLPPELLQGTASSLAANRRGP